jgi:hypothetical protein
MKAAVIIAPVVLIGGVLGAGMAGVINIPGLTPQKKPAAKKEPPKAKPAKATPTPTGVAPTAAPKKKAADPPAPDLAAGNRALAQVWTELPAKQVVEITSKWKDPELAEVLAQMDSETAGAILKELSADRASRLSRELRRLAAEAEAK